MAPQRGFAMKATIRSIAKTANVSPATVSRVLSGSTQVTPRMRSHVLNIARKLGYHSAGIRNVALIAGGNFFSGYDALLLQALHEELRHRNYRAVLVTMNMWGFTPDYFIHSENYFIRFLRENAGNIKAEYFIPLMVNYLITSGISKVKVLDTTSKWFGVTYAEDRPSVVAQIRALIDAGEYPEKLF